MQQFQKGAEMMVHSQALLASRIANLKAANNAASERKERKKKRIQKGGTLLQAEAEVIIAKREVAEQVVKERREERRQAGVTRQSTPRCKGCGNTRHNMRTCGRDAAELGK
jgi:hypothetical protein